MQLRLSYQSLQIDSVTERGVRIIKNIGKKTEQKIIGTGSKQWLVPIDDVDVSNDEEASSGMCSSNFQRW